MVAESAVVIASSLYISCSFFELKQSAGFILFHVILFLVACIPSMKWDIGIKKWFHLRPFAGDGVEIGSLLVPMVLTSQMAFIERWQSKYLKVTEIERSYLLATQLMSMLAISILLIVNHEKPLISSFFFFVVTTCIAATINVQWGMYSLNMVEGLRGVRFSLSDLIFNNQITCLHSWTVICLIMSKVTGRIGQLSPVTKFNYHMTTAFTTGFTTS